MSEDVEMVEVDEVARPRLAPVEYVGEFIGHRLRGVSVVPGVVIDDGQWFIVRPGPTGPWRAGRVRACRDERGHVEIEWWQIAAICPGDHVYRIGKPTTPSLEERVAMLERLVYPDLIIADDAEKSGRPEVAAELRARVPWWRDPGRST